MLRIAKKTQFLLAIIVCVAFLTSCTIFTTVGFNSKAFHTSSQNSFDNMLLEVRVLLAESAFLRRGNCHISARNEHGTYVSCRSFSKEERAHWVSVFFKIKNRSFRVSYGVTLTMFDPIIGTTAIQESFHRKMQPLMLKIKALVEKYGYSLRPDFEHSKSKWIEEYRDW